MLRMNNDNLVEACRTEEYYLEHKSPRDERVLRAISRVDRADFVPDLSSTYDDRPVSIGYEQTCSQPSMVAFMCDILELKRGMRVLEIGTGCGYHAAVTSHRIGPSGFLTTLEFIPALADVAKENLRKHFGLGLDERLEAVRGDGSVGYGPNSPYDRIYLTAGVSLKSFDRSVLAEQLNPEGGMLLFPEEVGSLFRQKYKKGKKVSEDFYENVWFVPLCGKNS
jgi:protein-L-isoaspartate(D-aspartate) O-methyltransferase